MRLKRAATAAEREPATERRPDAVQGNAAGSMAAAVDAPVAVARRRIGRRLSRPVEDCARTGLLEGKKALVFGVANDHSIAWGIAKALHDQGAKVGFSSMASLIKRRVRPLAASIGSTFVEACDVRDDDEIRQASSSAGTPGKATSTSWSTPSPSPRRRTWPAISPTPAATASTPPSTSASTR